MEYLTPGYNWDKTKKNFIEIDSAEGLYTVDPPESEATFRKYAYSKVANFLKNKGYSYIFFDNWAGNGRWSNFMKDNADFYFNYYETAGTSWVTEFSRIFWNTTMIYPFYNRISGEEFRNYYQYGILNTLDGLQKIPDMAGPKFVFAHIMCPHLAFVFGENGELVDPKNWVNLKDKQYYRGQYIYISKRIYEVVSTIINKSAEQPVIIIQSDHGIRPMHPNISIGPDEWKKILNAYHLPGDASSLLYDTISPVNSFRVIFNYYFHTEFPLLED
jgi:hypothetical protein